MQGPVQFQLQARPQQQGLLQTDRGLCGAGGLVPGMEWGVHTRRGLATPGHVLTSPTLHRQTGFPVD